jgi:acetaldehyde dehydrogenase
MIMRDTVFVLCAEVDESAIERAVQERVAAVQAYAPGYRLKQNVQFEHFSETNPVTIPELGPLEGVKVSVYLEVEGAADWLPAYAGNLDIMTAAALKTASTIAAHRSLREVA